jgi:hypothetical protein
MSSRYRSTRHERPEGPARATGLLGNCRFPKPSNLRFVCDCQKSSATDQLRTSQPMKSAGRMVLLGVASVFMPSESLGPRSGFRYTNPPAARFLHPEQRLASNRVRVELALCWPRRRHVRRMGRLEFDARLFTDQLLDHANRVHPKNRMIMQASTFCFIRPRCESCSARRNHGLPWTSS